MVGGEGARVTTPCKVHVPNGFDPDFAAYHGVVPKSFEEKENVILLVGRHGTPEKNSELLLEALPLMGELGEWQVIFVGPTTAEFDSKLAAFHAAHPALAEKVRCVGNVPDKGELFRYYNRTKIFCLPSRWECFPLVGPEALFFGNVLVMSREIVSSQDLTAGGEAGFVAEGGDAAAWTGGLTQLTQDREKLACYSARASRHFREAFVWKDVLQPLHSSDPHAELREVIAPRSKEAHEVYVKETEDDAVQV